MAWKAIIAATALALLATPVSAQVPPLVGEQLSRRLDYVNDLAARDSYQQAAGPFSGAIAQAHMQEISVTLRAGQDYRIVGVCDRRCGDLDLRLRDPMGAILAQDIAVNDVPVLSFRPTSTGRHTIQVFMAQCTAPRCWFAFNVYSR